MKKPGFFGTNFQPLQLLLYMLVLWKQQQSWKQMGEVVLSSEGGMELGIQETEMKKEITQPAEKKNQKKKITAEGVGSPAAPAPAADASSVVRWERFLPKLVVRVLLVEADDSTRQIIAALLRKCSYKGWFSSSNLLWDLYNFSFQILIIWYLGLKGCSVGVWWDYRDLKCLAC